MDKNELVFLLSEAEKDLQKFVTEAEKGLAYRKGKVDMLKDMINKLDKEEPIYAEQEDTA